MNRQTIAAAVGIVVAAVILSWLVFGRKANETQPESGPSLRFNGVTDLRVGVLYELDQPTGVALKANPSRGVVDYEITFGGRNRNMRHQYVPTRRLKIDRSLPAGTIKWVYRGPEEREGVVYNTSEKTMAYANPRPGQMVTDRSFAGGRERGR